MGCGMWSVEGIGPEPSTWPPVAACFPPAAGAWIFLPLLLAGQETKQVKQLQKRHQRHWERASGWRCSWGSHLPDKEPAAPGRAGGQAGLRFLWAGKGPGQQGKWGEQLVQVLR